MKQIVSLWLFAYLLLICVAVFTSCGKARKTETVGLSFYCHEGVTYLTKSLHSLTVAYGKDGKPLECK